MRPLRPFSRDEEGGVGKPAGNRCSHVEDARAKKKAGSAGLGADAGKGYCSATSTRRACDGSPLPVVCSGFFS
ncbi:hypothetical protein, partial [Pseudomonas aeruginosa]|uniref:hypothetical protein n=1 Tax=Pseudomonas aeruginosa TaxID=287 RepID=UPI002F90F5CB